VSKVNSLLAKIAVGVCSDFGSVELGECKLCVGKLKNNLNLSQKLTLQLPVKKKKYFWI